MSTSIENNCGFYSWRPLENEVKKKVYKLTSQKGSFKHNWMSEYYS